MNQNLSSRRYPFCRCLPCRLRYKPIQRENNSSINTSTSLRAAAPFSKWEWITRKGAKNPFTLSSLG